MKKIVIIICIVAFGGCADFNRHTIENTVAEINHYYPAIVDDGVVATEAIVLGDTVVFRYTVNEDVRSLDDFKALDSDARLQQLRLHGPEMESFIGIIERCKMSLKEDYVGSVSDEHVSIILMSGM